MTTAMSQDGAPRAIPSTASCAGQQRSGGAFWGLARAEDRVTVSLRYGGARASSKWRADS